MKETDKPGKPNNRLKPALLTLGLIAAVLLLFNPNPFGNDSAAVADESYFLSTALSSISHFTLPGWDFTPGGTYYAGVLTYVETALTAILVLALRLGTGSTLLTQAYFALHLGDLTQLTRWINAAFVLAAAIVLARLVLKREDPDRPKKKALALLAALMLGNSLFSTVMHTGKVWTIAMLFEAAAAVLVFLQENARRRGAKRMEPAAYVTALIWMVFLSFIQNYVPGLLAGVWLLYAAYLGHFNRQDFLGALKRSWLWLTLALAAQVAFIYGFFVVTFVTSNLVHLNDLSGSAILDAAGKVDELRQAVWAAVIAVKSQPLFMLLPVLFIWDLARNGWRALRSDRWKQVLYFQPVFAYVVFHLILKMGRFPRYALEFTLACALSLAFLPKPKIVERLLLPTACVLAAVVTLWTSWLFWHPASEKTVADHAAANLNLAGAAIIVDAPRLALPTNLESLKQMSAAQAGQKKNAFMLQHPELADRFVDFRPLVLFGPAKQILADKAEVLSSKSEVWSITGGCEAACAAAETEAGSCLAFNLRACYVRDSQPQEVSTIPDLFATDQLGNAYFLRKLK